MNRILLENSNNRHLIQIRTTVPGRHSSACHAWSASTHDPTEFEPGRISATDHSPFYPNTPVGKRRSGAQNGLARRYPVPVLVFA
jgi:hypothetical protein